MDFYKFLQSVEIISKCQLTSDHNKINALRLQVSPMSCLAGSIINGDYFKPCKSYKQMCDMCIKAFSHYHKQGPLTWLFRLAVHLEKGVSTRSIRWAIVTTGSLPNNIILNLWATEWAEDNDTITLQCAVSLFTFPEFLVMLETSVFEKLRAKDTLTPDLCICELGIQLHHIEATLPSTSVRAVAARPQQHTPKPSPVAPGHHHKGWFPTCRPSFRSPGDIHSLVHLAGVGAVHHR